MTIRPMINLYLGLEKNPASQEAHSSPISEQIEILLAKKKKKKKGDLLIRKRKEVWSLSNCLLGT